MFESLGKAMVNKSVPDSTVIAYGPWSAGLVTENQPEQMATNELFEGLNTIIVGSGTLRTRDGSTLVCTGCTGEIVQCADMKVDDTWYTIISDTDNKLYYSDDLGTATAIATLEGEPRFCAFMGLLLIFDGSYIKVWDGPGVSILYDNGLGFVSPYQFNNRYDTETIFKPLGNGTITRVDRDFTTQEWDTGYTIPPTHVYVKMRKFGIPTGTVTVNIRLKSDDSIIATSTISTAVADFVTGDDGLEYESIFQITDTWCVPDDTVIPDEYLLMDPWIMGGCTTDSGGMLPNTEYIVSLEYDGGDATNYVDVLAVDTDTPIMSLKPGKPPKAAFGLVFNDRLFCIEGENGDNPSYLWYCNAGNYLDWSSSDGGGYAPVIDQSATNYPIGGIAEWNSSLWVFGTPRQPFLGALSGSSPSSFAIAKTMQHVSGHYKSIVVTPDDIVFAHPSGIDMVSSVQESSDIAAKSQTDKIRTTIQKNYDTDAVAGYDPAWGLYVLKMAGDDDTYVVHTRAKAVKYSGQKSIAYSPVTRWRFAFAGAPTAFGHGNGFMLVGTDDGSVYKMDVDKVYDDHNLLEYKIKTSYSTTSFGSLQAFKLNVNAYGRSGGNFNFNFYKNASRTKLFGIAVDLPMDSETLTVDMDETPTLETDVYALSDAFFDRSDINFNFRTLMIGIEDIELYGEPIYFGKINVLCKEIGGF